MPVTMAIDALCCDWPVPPHAVKRTTDATITITLTSEYRLFITSPHDYIPQTFIRRGVVVFTYPFGYRKQCGSSTMRFWNSRFVLASPFNAFAPRHLFRSA